MKVAVAIAARGRLDPRKCSEEGCAHTERGEPFFALESLSKTREHLEQISAIVQTRFSTTP
jgi:hypothetical protein